MTDDPYEAFLTKLQHEHDKLGKFNLAVVGATGSGKSTLINAVFREDVARVGIGRPVTQHIERIERPGVPLVLFDTKGVELGDVADEVIADFRTLIAERRQLEPAEHIHMVWYCLRAGDNRIEDFQIRLIRDLANQGVPVILVLTQCLTAESDDVLEFSQSIRDLGLPTSPSGHPIATLAQPMRISSEISLQSFGLEELLAETLRVAPEAVHDAIINAERIDLDLKARRARRELGGFALTAAGMGASPIPFSDAPLLVTLQLGMLARIAAVFGIETSKETMTSLVLATTGSGGMAMAGRYLSRQLLKFIPGGNVAGSAISAAVATTLTTALGEAYIRVCGLILQRQLAGEAAFAPDELKGLVLEYYKEFLRRSNRPEDDPS